MNTNNIKDIIKVFEDSSLAKMELEIDDMKIKMEKPSTTVAYDVVTPVAAPAVERVVPFEAPVEEKQGVWVKAPIVGTYYNARATLSSPFVEIGKTVKKGDVLCIIEAMKVMNELHSPVDGVVLEILVTNESMVEYDQELIRIGQAHD